MSKKYYILVAIIILCIMLSACREKKKYDGITPSDTEVTAETKFSQDSTESETVLTTEVSREIVPSVAGDEPIETETEANPIPAEVEENPSEANPMITQPIEEKPINTEPTVATTSPEIEETLPPYMTDLG